MRVSFSSWYARAAVLLTLAAAGGAVYWFRHEISDARLSAQDAVLGALGLGVAPIAVWMAVFLWALAKRRSWFWHFNIWIGSLVYLAFILGLLSFFEPSTGVLGAFTLEGEVTLGGDVGQAIAGPIVWQGALRLLAVLILGAAIAAPRPTLALAAAAGRLGVYAYVLSALAARRIVSALSRMYRIEPESRVSEIAEDIRPAKTLTSTDGPSAAALPETSQPSGMRSGEIGARSLAAPAVGLTVAKTLPAPALTASDPAPSPPNEEQPSPDLMPDSANKVESAAAPAVGKHNRFWSEGTHEPEADADLDEEGASPILDTSGASWERPPMELLLGAHEGGISEAQMTETAETIKRTLGEYGIEVELGQIRPGPTVTMYGLTPGWVRRHKQVKVTDEDGRPKLDESGRPIVTKVETRTRVKVDSILSREKDLALALKTPSIRMETPVMGESLLGIEVPNPSPNLVTLRGVMESEEFKRLRPKAKLPIALGESSGGETVVVDLAQMPHLLVAGATGSGKSVCINTIVSCLTMEKTPAELRLLLVDPKRVELTPYNGIPHLLTPVVVETDQVVALLKGVIREMLNRYRRMEEVAVRNIEAYNGKMPEKMPYLVVAIDELADLMMSASFDVEQSICRLAQLGRATGIHLIIATQRPSVDVVTGLIKANFPSRVSFGVTSQIDSRTILDTAGAEKLLGKGDMLYLPVDGSKPKRVQGVYISDREIEDMVNFWKRTDWAPLPKVSLHAVGDDSDDRSGSDGGESEAKDELLDKAIDLAQHYNKLSTSLLQRRMRIGYPRAARLMDQLEEEGVVGPGDGSKSRDVIMSQM